MSVVTYDQNIDPTSDEMPPDNPNRSLLFGQRVTGPPDRCFCCWGNHVHTRDCVNCNIRHASRESKENAYCNECKDTGRQIFSWYKRRYSKRYMYHGILVLNVISKRIGTGEAGLSENIMSFV
jgi:hypothetical protein